MDTVLISVTTLSLAMAAAMAIVVMKLLRDDRARSEARIAALAGIAAEAEGDVDAMFAEPRATHVPREALRRSRADQLDDLEIRPAQPVVAGAPDLFAVTSQPSPWGRRAVVAGAIAAVVAAVAFALSSAGPRAPGAQSSTAAADATPPVEAAPLELVALRHTREAQTLTVSGLVQNPHNGAPLSHVVAAAFLFGPDGAFLTSSRAALDFSTLSPGGESPFVVTIPVTGEVSRYRIGFRDEDGRVIAHIDRRTADTLASKQERP